MPLSSPLRSESARLLVDGSAAAGARGAAAGRHARGAVEVHVQVEGHAVAQGLRQLEGLPAVRGSIELTEDLHSGLRRAHQPHLLLRDELGADETHVLRRQGLVPSH